MPATRGLLLVCLAASGCAAGGRVDTAAGTVAAEASPRPAAGETYGAETPRAAVIGFLDAVRDGDFVAMARLFGTTDGPAHQRWGHAETEQRMFILAGLLDHSAHTVRPHPVTEPEGGSRWIARLAGTARGDVSLPVIVVASGGRWFVQQIVTQALSGR